MIMMNQEFAAHASFGIDTGLVRTFPTIAITTNSTTSKEFGTLAATGRMFEAAAESLGLEPLTHAKIRTPPRTRRLDVVVTTRTATLEFDRKTAFKLTGAHDILQQWISESFKSVRVIFGARGAASGTLEAMVRDITAMRNGYIGYATLWDFRAETPELERFSFLSDAKTERKFDFAPQELVSTFVDANILIDMRNSLEHEESTPSFATMRDLGATLRGMDAIPGFAIGEISTANANPDSSTARVRAAIDVFNTLPLSDLEPETARAAYKRLKDEHLSAQSPVERNQELLITLNYLSMLKLASTYIPIEAKSFNGSERIAAYREYNRTLDVGGIGFSAYPLMLARELLLGNGEKYLRRVLIPKGALDPHSILRAQKNASWDLFYASLADLAASGNMNDIHANRVYLLTQDKRLAHIRSAVSLVGQTISNGVPTGIVSIDDDLRARFTDSQVTEIRRIDHERAASATLRTLMAPEFDLELARAMIAELEDSLTAMLATNH